MPRSLHMPVRTRAALFVLAATVFPAASLVAQEAETPPPATAEDAATDPIFRVSLKRTRTRIVERFSKIVELEPRIRRVDGFDPEILSVTGVQGKPNQIRVHALAPGVTSLVLTDEDGETYNVEVFVTGDVRHLQAYLERMFPHATVEAVEVRDSVVLRGWVTQPSNITKMVEIAEQFYPRVLNQMEVGGVQQVQLRVRVMEVQRSKLRAFGINFLYGNRNGYLASLPGNVVSVQGIANLSPLGGGAGGGAASSLIPGGFADATFLGGVIDDNNLFQAFVEALKTESLLKILAEPELVTTNGRPANMLAGGEFPILVPQSLGTTTIEWREFGVRLEAVPHILGRGRVRLELQPEVSERDFTNAVVIQGTTVPGLTTRRANTQVEMKFGQTFVVAGLISNRENATTQKVPFLGELPWIGAAFRRVSYEDAETELVILVTPELVGPLEADQIPPGGPGQFTDEPTDRELFRDGMIEVPRYGDECEDCLPVPFGPAGSSYGPTPDPRFAPGAAPVRGQMLPPPTEGDSFTPTSDDAADEGGEWTLPTSVGSRRRTVSNRVVRATRPAPHRTESASGRPGLIGPGGSGIRPVAASRFADN